MKLGYVEGYVSHITDVSPLILYLSSIFKGRRHLFLMDNKKTHTISLFGGIMNLTTPALLFPAISLLFLAYTNRFLVLAQLIRQLHDREEGRVRDMVHRQIDNLKRRIALIRWMQGLGVMAFILCATAMFFLFIKMDTVAKISFGLSLLLLVLSLVVSLVEIAISTQAIQIELEDLAANHGAADGGRGDGDDGR